MSSYVQLLKWTVVVYVLCIVLERMVPFDAPFAYFFGRYPKASTASLYSERINPFIGLTGLFWQDSFETFHYFDLTMAQPDWAYGFLTGPVRTPKFARQNLDLYL